MGRHVRIHAPGPVERGAGVISPRGCTIGLLAALASLLSSFGCAKAATVHGIPNFAQVAPGIWRSGQPPATAEAWDYLGSLGIRTIVKLNMPDEGNDDLGRARGMTVHELGIEPANDGNVFDQIAHTLVEPDKTLVDEAVRILAAGGGGVLVHCVHGQDRTGLAVGIWRVRALGWSKTQAWEEMKAHGYHTDLLGLNDFWDEHVP